MPGPFENRFLSRSFVAAVSFASSLLLAPAPASAQQTRSGWGLQASFAPQWTVPEPAQALFGDEASIEGDDLRIGFVRGRTLSGDWGLSFVRKKIKDGSYVVIDDYWRFSRDVVVSGVALDKFTPFGTIKQRVQIGITYGIGAGWAEGDVQEAELRTGRVYATEPSFMLSPMDAGLSFVPMARLELTAAVIVIRGVKIKATGGFNYPGVSKISVGAVYIFGGR